MEHLRSNPESEGHLEMVDEIRSSLIPNLDRKMAELRVRVNTLQSSEDATSRDRGIALGNVVNIYEPRVEALKGRLEAVESSSYLDNLDIDNRPSWLLGRNERDRIMEGRLALRTEIANLHNTSRSTLPNQIDLAVEVALDQATSVEAVSDGEIDPTMREVTSGSLEGGVSPLDTTPPRLASDMESVELRRGILARVNGLRSGTLNRRDGDGNRLNERREGLRNGAEVITTGNEYTMNVNDENGDTYTTRMLEVRDANTSEYLGYVSARYLLGEAVGVNEAPNETFGA